MKAEVRAATAIIVAGGSGERVGRAGGKQMAPVRGEPMLVHTVRPFDRAPSVRHIIIVCPPGREAEYADAVATHLAPSKPLRAVAGGETRQMSVAAGIAAADADEFVIVHDGARPLVTTATIEAAVSCLAEDPSLDGIVVGHPAYDTLKVVVDGLVVETPDRARLWVAQTPQVFRREVLAAAYRRAAEEGMQATDDASLVEAVGGGIRMLDAPRDNLKVTVDSDLAIVEAVLSRREGTQ